MLLGGIAAPLSGPRAGAYAATTNFRPSGHGIVTPQRVSTAAVPQVRSTNPTAPAGAGITPASLTSQQSSLNVTDVPAATSLHTPVYAGLGSNGAQPDSNGAGGKYNYIEMVNQQFAIYSRIGQLQYSTTLKSWFGKLGGKAGSFYDVNVIYDQSSQRFIFAADIGNAFLVSVAQQTNATSGDFCNYSFPYGSYGLDFDKLGVDPDGVYLTADVLSGSTGQQVGNVLLDTNRAAMESCGSATYTEWQNLTNPDGSIAEAVTPAVQDTASGSAEYLVNSYPAGACQLTLWTLSNTGALSNASVATQCYSPPPPAIQKGTTCKIDPGDSSVSKVSFINGSLTLAVAGSYDWGDGNGPVGIAQWFVIDAATATVSTQGAFGTHGYWLLYPAVESDYNGNLTVLYGTVGPSSYPALSVVRDVGGTYSAPLSLIKSTVPYTRCSSSATQICHWGDYQSAWLDDGSVDPNGIWVTGQYATSASAWGTEFALLPASVALTGSSATPGMTVGVSGSSFGNGEMVNIYWDSTTGTPLTSMSSSGTGTFSINIQVPPAVIGSHAIVAVGQTSGQEASATLTITPSLTVAPNSGLPGTTTTIAGSGYHANSVVTVYWNCASRTCAGTSVLGTVTTDATGDFSNMSATIPATALAGSYWIGGTDSSGAFAKNTYKVT